MINHLGVSRSADKPLVSIIMPTYKASNSLIMSLESAINQTYDNFEVIIVDDNGDETEYQKKTEHMLKPYLSDKVIYIKHEANKNGAAARNTGMKICKGEYITFLDDDDYMDTSKIEKQVELFLQLNNTYGLVYCSGYVVNSLGVGYPLKIVDNNHLFNLLTGRLRFNSSMMMIRRSVYELIGGFDEAYRRHQDWEYCCRIFDRFYAKALPERLVIKYSLNRNNIQDPNDFLVLKNFFLNKNEYILNKLSAKEKREVYMAQYREVALLYFRLGEYKECHNVLSKYANPSIELIKIIQFLIKEKLKKRKKYGVSILNI